MYFTISHCASRDARARQATRVFRKTCDVAMKKSYKIRKFHEIGRKSLFLENEVKKESRKHKLRIYYTPIYIYI